MTIGFCTRLSYIRYIMCCNLYCFVSWLVLELPVAVSFAAFVPRGATLGGQSWNPRCLNPKTTISSTEFLHLSWDANAQVQRLEAEKRKLLVAHLERAAEADLSSEVQRLRGLYWRKGCPRNGWAGRGEPMSSGGDVQEATFARSRWMLFAH